MARTDFSGTTEGSPLGAAGMPRWQIIYILVYAALGLFAALALAMWIPHPAVRGVMALALTSYAGILFSFTGGLHWGVGLRYLAITSHMPVFHFIWGPIPALMAWFAMLLHTRVALLLMAAIAMLAHLVDARVWPGSGLAPWVPLRQHFTLGAIACCVLGALAVPW